MDWGGQADGEVLEQILALLVSFAALADRAAMMPLCFQLPGLAYLVEAEAVARSFVVGLPFGAPAAVTLSQSEDRATRLATDFRALAVMLRALLALARRRARLLAREASPSKPPRVPSGAQWLQVVRVPAPDTS